MASTKRQITTPLQLDKLIRQRKRENGYETDSEYFTALAVYDLYVRIPHWLTRELFRQAREAREAIFREIAAHFADPQRPVAYFEHRLQEAVRAVAGKRAS